MLVARAGTSWLRLCASSRFPRGVGKPVSKEAREITSSEVGPADLAMSAGLGLEFGASVGTSACG